MKTLNPPASLTGTHLRTYERIFQHPVSHNLAWREVLALFGHLGEVAIEKNGHLKITRNGHLLILTGSRAKDVSEVEGLMKLRHFLELSETALVEADQPPSLMLVVIDHQKARLFPMEMNGTAPQLILPYKSNQYLRCTHEGRDFSSGKENPVPHDFFAQVATALKGVGQILLFGTGTGTSSEMEQFTNWLKKHHHDLAQRIIGAVAIDEHHLTEPQLQDKAREFYQAQQASNPLQIETAPPTTDGRVRPYGEESVHALTSAHVESV